MNGLRDFGASSASHRVFPFSKVSGTTRTLAYNTTLAASQFVGVAAWHSDSGVTEEVAVWVNGLFRFPLKSSRFAKPLLRVIPCGSGTTLFNQKVALDAASSDYIGLCAEFGSFKSSAEVVLRSRRTDLWTL
jgi:hypothetical protein